MPVIVNSQPQLGKTKEYRLSIQADLNGFSFSVVDDAQQKLLYLFASDFAMDREDMTMFAKRCASIFKNQPILGSKFKKTTILYDTEKFSAIPRKLHVKERDLAQLNKIHKTEELDEINNIYYPNEDMVLVFAANSTLLNLIKEYQPVFTLYPMVFLFLSYLPLFKEHNKISFHYMKGVATIVAAEGERIVYCNSFPAMHFNSALYFLLLALKETQFNAEQTTVYISGNIKDLEIFDIAKYFSTVKYFRNPAIPLTNQFTELKYSRMMFDL